MHLVEFPYLKIGGDEIDNHDELKPMKKKAVRKE